MSNRAPSAPSRTPAAPLVVSDDPGLLSALERLAAAAGARTEVARDVAAATERWRTAPVVLVGADLAGALADRDVARRAGVHLVGHGGAGEHLFRDAVSIGAESVVTLPAADRTVVQVLADASDGAALAARVVGVVGGSGGVGATTLAVALAGAAARRTGPAAGAARLGAVLVDADPMGGGVERLLGLDAPVSEGTDWGRVAESRGRLGAASLRRALPVAEHVGVLGWGGGARAEVDAAVAREALDAARRAGGLVVVDLSRHPGAMTVELLHRCDDLVVLSGCSLPATAACARLLTTHACAARTHLVVREVARGLVAEDVARALGRPLRAVLGRQRGLDELVDLGVGPAHVRRGPLRRAVRTLLSAVGPDPASPA